MAAPLLARFALDAQASFASAAAAVPPSMQNEAPHGLNSAAWLVVHAASTHQLWIASYVGGKDVDRWFDPFRDDPPHVADYSAAMSALDRVLEESRAVLSLLTDADIPRAGAMREESRFAGWTVGQLIARTVAHLYVHAADLNTLAMLGGAEDGGLPGWMPNTRFAP